MPAGRGQAGGLTMRRRRERKAPRDAAGAPGAQSGEAAGDAPVEQRRAAGQPAPVDPAGTPTAAYWTPGRPVAGQSSGQDRAGQAQGSEQPLPENGPYAGVDPLTGQASSGSPEGGLRQDSLSQSEPRAAASQETRPISRDAAHERRSDAGSSETA